MYRVINRIIANEENATQIIDYLSIGWPTILPTNNPILGRSRSGIIYELWYSYMPAYGLLPKYWIYKINTQTDSREPTSYLFDLDDSTPEKFAQGHADVLSFWMSLCDT